MRLVKSLFSNSSGVVCMGLGLQFDCHPTHVIGDPNFALGVEDYYNQGCI